MKTRSTLLCLLVTLVLAGGAPRVLAATTEPSTFRFSQLVTGAGPLLFSFPSFDPSLGSLQNVEIGWDFSGTVVGNAYGVGQSSSINSTVTHWVFFDFRDTSDGVNIAEPTLSLSASIPTGAQNATIAFGPTFQSTKVSFSVTSGDPRFGAWENGPANISGSLSVFFTDTAIGWSGLQNFSGTDSGVYSGSLSIAYSYVPVPEPCGLTLAAVGLLLVYKRMHRTPR
jgi:hypothetical protein